MAVQIVPMDRDTVGQVAQLEQRCFAAPWSLESLSQELDNSQAVFYTALCQGQVVGYVGMHDIWAEGYVTNLAVDPAHRGQGIGRKLMQALVRYAVQHQLSLVTLEVRPSNTAARQLYQSMGFVEEGRRKHYYQHPNEDALILTLRFAPGGEEENT